MARFNARTPSNGAPGIIVRRRKRDRERLRQRWEKRKLEEEARKSGEKSQQIQEEGQADEEYANAATPGSEDVVMEGSETEETTTIGSEGEHNEVSTDAVLDTTVNIEVTAPTPPDRTLGVEVQVRDEQVAIDGETADKKALTPEEEELSEDKPTTETESNQDNAFTTSTKPHTDTPPTVERTEEMEHDHIPGPVESSLNPSVTVEEKLHDTQDSMSEDTKELKYVSEDPDSIPEDTGYVKRDTNVQAAELDCKFPVRFHSRLIPISIAKNLSNPTQILLTKNTSPPSPLSKLQHPATTMTLYPRRPSAHTNQSVVAVKSRPWSPLHKGLVLHERRRPQRRLQKLKLSLDIRYGTRPGRLRSYKRRIIKLR